MLSCSEANVTKEILNEEIDIEKSIESEIIQKDTIIKKDYFTLTEIDFDSINLSNFTKFEEAKYHIDSSFVRKIDSLHFQLILNNNYNVNFKNYFYEDIIYKEYFYLGYEDEIEKHIVRYFNYETESFLLIDHNSYKIDTIIGFPFFSPNKKFVFTLYINPYAEYEDMYFITGDFRMYNSSTLDLIFQKPYELIPIEINWESEDILLFKTVNSDVWEYEKYIYNDSLYNYYQLVRNKN